jgi:hypothetical protein
VFAICRLAPEDPIPDWVQGVFISITRTADELSIVCPLEYVPSNVLHSGDWRAFQVVGPLDFNLTGVMASLARPLAEAGVTIFAFSTYDTDYVFVRQRDLKRAVQGLAREGHNVQF